MCYWCHTLGYNIKSPDHRSKNCKDPHNNHSINYNPNIDIYNKFCTTCKLITIHIIDESDNYRVPFYKCLRHNN